MSEKQSAKENFVISFNIDRKTLAVVKTPKVSPRDRKIPESSELPDENMVLLDTHNGNKTN